MSEKKLDCEIVRDLLPLYHDDVVSEVTKAAVSEHLSECADCAVEFLKLRRELPEEKEVTPKKTFADLLRTRKKYRILALVTAFVLLCGLLIGGYFLQAQFPVVRISGKETAIKRIYRYETEEQYKYFVIFSYPLYDGMKITTEEEQVSEDSNFLGIACYRPLISRNHGMDTRILVIDCGYETADDGSIRKLEYDMVLGGGDIADGDKVWHADVNADDEVPAYVYEYEGHLQHGGGCTLDVEQNLIGFDCADGVFRWWDLDGNELEQPLKIVG